MKDFFFILMILLIKTSDVRAQKQKVNDSTEIQGYVIQTIKEKPLSNAVVYLEKKGNLIAGTITDTAGHYVLKIAATREKCSLKVVHPGCEKGKFSVNLFPYKTSIDFYLTPKEYTPTWDWVFLYCPLPYALPGNSIYYRDQIHNMAY